MTEDLERLTVAELKRRGIPPKLILAEMKRRGMSRREMAEAYSPMPPISSRVGSRRFRQRVVIALYGTWLLGVVSFELSFRAKDVWTTNGLEVLGVCALVIASLAILWLSRRITINAPRLADRELDERLVQIKNQAYRTAFQIFGAVVLIGWPFSLVLISQQPGGSGVNGALVLFGCVSLLVTTLPTAVMAWREPDPTAPDTMPA